MAEQNKRSEIPPDALTDEAVQLKKRARRRLIGAAALALLAAIVLPLVMDHRPAPSFKDIQVRIPSPDEGTTQRVAPRQEAPAIATTEAAVPEAKREAKPEAKLAEKTTAANEVSEKTAAESWEIQLGAYQEAARVKLLVDKLNGVRLPSYTEKVETPHGPRTRVRVGPFPSQEAAEKARARLKIIGVDGPVAKKP